jgi:peptidoglycan-N-acetylglucosamine deacetylase
MMIAESSSRRGRRWSGRHIAASAGIVALLALLAFALVPTSQLNSRSFVQINGATYAVQAGAKISTLTELSALLARPGSRLDLTGDVVALAEGSPATRRVNGRPIAEDLVLGDGSLVLVRHGEHVLEGLKRKTEVIPFETTIKGKGVVVRLLQTGAPGQRETFKGASSGKQAAAFVVSAPQDKVLQRSATAKPGEKLAALTFDDGPGKYTQGVLDALAAKHVPATFFVLGDVAAGNKAMIAKTKAAGHEVENHTWSHPILTQVSADRVRSEISRTNSVIGGSRFLRPPYGTYNAAVAAQARAMGLRLALWTVDTLDWRYPDADAILSRVIAQTKPGAIILMHDGGNNRSQTVAAIPRVVNWLLAHGYALTTVDVIL